MEPSATCLVVDVQVARLREQQAPEVADVLPDNYPWVLEDQPTSKQVSNSRDHALLFFVTYIRHSTLWIMRFR